MGSKLELVYVCHGHEDDSTQITRLEIAMCYMIVISDSLYTDTLPNLVSRKYRSTLCRNILARMNRARP
jgi:hypothetical protein